MGSEVGAAPPGPAPGTGDEDGPIMRRDIDEALKSWPHDPRDGELAARSVRARDGRSVLQIRLELGILQMEVDGRPDGTRPRGFPSYLDYLRHRAADRPNRRRSDRARPWKMGPEHSAEVDREFVQYYHRRMAWLSLHHYEQALADADHTLALMDFIVDHGPDAEYIARHERYRGLVLYHRTQAAAALALETRKPEDAIDALREGIELLGQHIRGRDDDDHHPWSDDEPSEPRSDSDPFRSAPHDAALIEHLRQLEQEIRKTFPVSKTLREQLAEAVEREDYESAARIRDQIRHRPGPA